MPEHQQTQQSTESKSTVQKQATPRIQAPISNPMAIIQRARINPKSLTHADVMQLQRTIGNRAVVRLLSEIGAIPSKAKQAPPVQRQELVQRQEIPAEEEPLQGKFESGPEKETCPSCMQRQEIPEEEEPLQGKFENKPEIACPSCFAAPIVQRQEMPEEEEEPLQGKMIETVQRQEIPEEEEPLQTKKENNTGMPDNLKAGVESLSGIDISDVRVHYNSSKPANVGALAYTQGTNIHVAPGQERHLPHEAWHVVQQTQGRVQATTQMKGLGINDDPSLEHEADMMGAKTAHFVPAFDGEMLHGKLGQEGHLAHEAWHVAQQGSGGTQKQLIQMVSSKYEIRPGSIIFKDAPPVSAEVLNVHVKGDNIEKVQVITLEGEYKKRSKIPPYFLYPAELKDWAVIRYMPTDREEQAMLAKLANGRAERRAKSDEVAKHLNKPKNGRITLYRFATQLEVEQIAKGKNVYDGVVHKGSSRNAVWFSDTKKGDMSVMAGRPKIITINFEIPEKSYVNFSMVTEGGEAGFPDEILLKEDEPNSYGIGRNLISGIPLNIEDNKKEK